MNYIEIFTYVMSIFTGISRSNPEAMGVWKEYMVYCCRAVSRALKYGERFAFLLKASEMKDGEYSRNFASFGIECVANALEGKNPILEQKLFARNEGFSLPLGKAVYLERGETLDGKFYVEDRRITGWFKVDQPCREVVIHIDTRTYLAQQDKHSKLFMLQLQTRAQAMAKAGQRLNSEQELANGVIGTIDTINTVQQNGYKVFYRVRKGLGDYLAYVDGSGAERVLTTIYYPWAGNNLLSRLLLNKELKIEYIETYSSSAGNELIAVAGSYME